MEEEKKDVKKEEKKKFEKVDGKKAKKEAKKSKEKKPKDKKEKKSGNKITKIIIAIVCAITVIGVVAVVLLKGNKPGPEKTIENLLTSVKNTSSTDENASYNYNEILKSIGLVDKESDELKNLFFEKLEWKVLNVTENAQDNTAVVEMEIKNKDFEKVVNNYINKVVELVLAGTSVSEEDYEKYLTEELKKEDLGVVTVTRNVEMKKENDKWEVSDINGFLYDLCPGLKEAINANSMKNK